MADLVSGPTAVANGAGYTAPAGSSRVVVAVCIAEPSAGVDLTLSALTLGGNAMTVVSIDHPTSSPKCVVAIAYLLEADIQAGSQTLSATWSDAIKTNAEEFQLYTLDSVDQTGGATTVPNTGAAGGNFSTGGSLPFTSSDDAFLLGAMVTAASGATSTTPAGWTEDVDAPAGAANMALTIHHKAVTTGGSEAYDPDWSASQSGWAMVAAEFANGSAGDVTAPTTGSASLQAGGTRAESFQVATVDDTQASEVTVFAVVVPLADGTPSAAQIVAGTDDGDVSLAAGLVDSDTVVSLPGTASLSFTGIPGDADQKLCWVPRDNAASPNLGAVSTLTISAPGGASSSNKIDFSGGLQ